MQDFDIFTKGTTRLKTLYWKVLNYKFLSPFIAKLRYEELKATGKIVFTTFRQLDGYEEFIE